MYNKNRNVKSHNNLIVISMTGIIPGRPDWCSCNIKIVL